MSLRTYPGAVVFAVPEPDDVLRPLMRALWARYPDHPPYGKPGSDPPPHTTLARLDVPPVRTLEGVVPASPDCFRRGSWRPT